MVVDCTAIPERVLAGYLVGKRVGSRVPVFVGLPSMTCEDQLKALGAAAASSGGVAMFHVVGVTPEAPSVEAALGPDRSGDLETITLTTADLQAAREELTTAGGERLDAVSIGTPHASIDEVAALAAHLADGPPLASNLDVYLSMGRSVLAEAEGRGHVAALEAAGVRIVVDTCTYVTPILGADVRVAMTNSGKWAHYTPANLGVDVVLGSLAECVASARAGRVVLDPETLR